VNAKTYCAQAKKKWKDLQARAHQLDAEYDKKIEELGTICSTMFKEIKDPQISKEVNQELEQQMGENKQKLDVLKRFVKEVNICLEKVSALEGENRADLLVMFNGRLNDYQVQAQKLDKVLTEMTIRRVIEESFGGDRGQREVEERILSGEGNQKSVNTYLIQKIHTLEDRVNAKFDHEKSQLA
jgi:DNA-binding ferritin-like protein (Dps family)